MSTPLKERSYESVGIDGVHFTQNVTLAQGSQYFYRDSYFFELPIVTGVIYASVIGNIDAITNSTKNVTSDALLGLAYFPSLFLGGFAPTVWVAYYTADKTVDKLPSGVDVDISAAASYVSTVYYSLEEVDSASGKVYNTIFLRALSWSESQTLTDSTGNIKYVTFSASLGTLQINLTVIASNVFGTTNTGATLSPSSLETVVDISGYQYTNSQTNLNLTLHVATLSVDSVDSYTSTNTLIAGSGSSQVYSKFSKTVTVNGATTTVTISGITQTVSSNEIDNTYVQEQLTSQGNLHSDVRKIVIAFPVGASQISYDPSIGTDASWQSNSNSSALIIPTLFCLILTLAVLLF